MGDGGAALTDEQTAALDACLRPEWAEENVRLYFDTGWFTGRFFESFGGGGDATEDRDRITAADVVAVSMLGVNVPAAAAAAMVEGEAAAEIGKLLQDVPTDRCIWEIDEVQLLDDRAPAWKLWPAIRSHHDMGPTKTSKLLARKRPHLLPVWDQFVGEVLGDSVGHWARVRSVMVDDTRRGRIQEIADASAPDRVSLLRVLDVAIWMDRTGRAQWDARR
jgi:hypothetical protein